MNTSNTFKISNGPCAALFIAAIATILAIYGFNIDLPMWALVTVYAILGLILVIAAFSWMSYSSKKADETRRIELRKAHAKADKAEAEVAGVLARTELDKARKEYYDAKTAKVQSTTWHGDDEDGE